MLTLEAGPFSLVLTLRRPTLVQENEKVGAKIIDEGGKGETCGGRRGTDMNWFGRSVS